MDTSAGHILVVEHDPDTGELLELLLQDAGYTVRTATTVSVALAALEAGTPDLVITDDWLCGTGRCTIMDHLRDGVVSATLPVLLCTADLDTARKRPATNAPHTTVFQKPFDIDELLQHVNRLLAQRSSLSS